MSEQSFWPAGNPAELARSHEQAPPYDRAACIDHTVDNAEPFIRSLSGYSAYKIEGRYWQTIESYRGWVSDEAPAPPIEAVDQTWQELTAQVKAGITDEELRQIEEGARTAREAFGRQVLTLAEPHGLIFSQIDEMGLVGAFPELEPRIDAVTMEIIEEAEGPWKIIATIDNGPLLVETSATSESGRFNVVALDRLFEANPDGLRTLIQDTQIAYARGHLAGSIGRNISRHASDSTTVVPEYLRSLTDTHGANPEAAQHATDEIRAFIKSLIATEEPDYIGTRTRKLLNRLSFFDDDRFYYLQHMAACPGISDAERETAEQQRTYDRLLGAMHVHTDQVEPEHQESGNRLAILQDPADFTIDLQNLHQRIQEIPDQVARHERAADFMESTIEIETPEELRAALAERWPEASAMWDRVSASFNRSDDSEDMLLETLATLLPFDHSHFLLGTNEDGSLWVAKSSDRGDVRVRLDIGKELADNYKLQNYCFRDGSRPEELRSPELRALMPYVILKSILQNFAGRPSPDTSVLDHYRNEQRAMVEASRKEANALREQSGRLEQRIEERRTAFEGFKAELGITDDEVQAVMAAAPRYEYPDSPFYQYVALDRSVFRPLFTALVLHKRGRINATSPVFQSFLRAFTNKPDLDLSVFGQSGAQ